MHRPSSHGVRGLLALPDELIARCLPEDPGACSSSVNGSIPVHLTTCKRFMQVAARGTRHGSLRLRLPLLKKDKKAALRLLTQSCPSLHQVELTVMEGSHLSTLLSPPPDDSTAGPAWLHNITNLRVKTCVREHKGGSFHASPLTQLVHSSLTRACPVLTELEYQQTSFSSEQPPSALPKLERLELHGCQQLPTLDHLRGQLQALPSLRHLTYLPAIDGHQQDDPYTICTAVSEVLSSRATHLHLFAAASDTNAVPAQQLLASPYPVLLHLALPGAIIDDKAMTALLSNAPQVRHVEVDEFQLVHDYSGATCAWMQVYTRCVDVLALTRLPLHSVTQLGIMPSAVKPTLRLTNSSSISSAMQLELTAQAISVVGRCGGLRQPADAHDRRGGVTVEVSSEQVLFASMPLFTHLRAITLCHTHITNPLLEELGKLPELRMLGFGTGSTFHKDVWSAITSLLPQVVHLHFMNLEAWPAYMVFLAENATHTITVSLDVDSLEAAKSWFEGMTPSCRPKFVTFLFV